jgi:hypothetical protein
MTGGEHLRKRALASLRSEKRIGPHFKPETLSVDADGTATIEAEVETVAIKRLALERLAAVPGIGGIVDRLRVRPASPMSDDGILDHLRKAYSGACLPAVRHRGAREGSNRARASQPAGDLRRHRH